MVNQNKQETSQQTQSPLPSELRTVLMIFEADNEMKTKALPCVDLEKREINWNKIFSQDFASGHRAALVWAKALWTDQSPVKSDPFDRAFSMDTHLRKAVVQALAMRWGLGL